jgi:hypothetical protein
MAERYFYWTSTMLLSLLYLASATMYLVKRDWVRQALADLGYPGYLVPILATVKILAVAAILSRVSVALSDLAYVGMFYHLLLSASAHFNGRKPGGALPAMAGLVLVIASFLTQTLTRVAAREWGADKVTVNNVMPIADTWGAADTPPPANALGRYGSPEEDVAPVVLFLACNDAQFMTGYSLTPDGGMIIDSAR